MTEKEFLDIRKNPQKRDDFLITLTKNNKRGIHSVAKKTGRHLITNDLIQNECSQYFMLGANRAIDKVILQDDGRGKNNPVMYCIISGFRNIQDFLISEFRINRKNRPEFSPITRDEYNIPDYCDYEREILENIIINDIIEKLKPIDRQILQLILNGTTDNIALTRTIRSKNISNNIVKVVASTLGYSDNYIYTRLYILREVFSVIPL